MSEQPGIKELLTIQGLTTISNRELAELRAENERLQESELAIIGCARTWKARAEKAEAALEKAQAANVVLRDAMSAVLPRFKAPVSAWESACNDEALLIAKQLAPLLASPDPGAGVRRVAEAAQQHFERFKGIHEISCPICEAVRALRGEE